MGAGRLALLSGLAALGALATNILLPAFPAMARDMGVGQPALAWTLSAFFATFAVGQLVVGPVTDAIGRARPVLVGLALFAIGSAVGATADSFAILVVARVIQALGACVTAVLTRAIARDLFTGPALTRVLALIMIAMAAAPGFSPALGTAATSLFGWRATFVLMLAVAVLLAVTYLMSAGETLTPDRRTRLRLGDSARTYARLLRDRRFLAPAVTVSLMIGCLYTFFGAAPAILLERMAFSPAGLSLFFAATVLVVFASGLAGPRLAARFGTARVGMTGLVIALAAGIALLSGLDATTPVPFVAAITLFLLGMGTINPIGTAITLEPFGATAGSASALLGFLQMAAAGLGTALIGVSPWSPLTTCSAIIAVGSLGGVIAFRFACA
ncbi:multidrug transporter CflA [Sphingomonas sp. Leaf33]|nr:multidrug transporter CflA [Sphingomonas sp. Leaf33]